MEEMRHHKRILVVEDDAHTAWMIQERLKSCGFSVSLASTGEEARREMGPEPPDLVVLDLMLPDCSGLSLCRELKRQVSPWHLPILMLTAADRPVERVRGYAAGTDAYLVKPFDGGELVQTVEHLISAAA